MGFRIVEISKPADIHIKKGQLEIAQEEGTVLIPIEDISQITLAGPNIRLSSMDISILVQSKVGIMTLGERYLPTAMVLPYEGNSRQSQLIHRQVAFGQPAYDKLWIQIIRAKISNQARALSILGLNGMESVAVYAENLTAENVNSNEALAAKEYFRYYHEGLNRRSDDPVNSRLNYGYAIVRSAIARAVSAVGFHPAFGIHHQSQLNNFNLIDDLIEPYRPIVDLAVHQVVGANIRLTPAERKAISHVLFNACKIDQSKVNVLTAIDIMADSLKRIIGDSSDEELLLPMVLSIEAIEGVTE